MVYTIEYKRIVRVRPYETVTIGIMEEFEGANGDYGSNYQGLKAWIDMKIDEALEEFGEDGN